MYDGQEIAAVDVQTKYEFVTLNVRNSAHTATVSMMIPMPSVCDYGMSEGFPRVSAGRCL